MVFLVFFQTDAHRIVRHSLQFPALFDDIERESSNLYISSYGVSNTSLEEVFLQLADSNEEYESSTHVNLDQSTVHSFQYMNGLSQVQLLLRKRFIIQRRDLKGLFFKIGLPVILICCVLMVLLIDVPIEGTPIGLSAELYNTSGRYQVMCSRNDIRFIETKLTTSQYL